MYTDASGVGVGACLHAIRKDGEFPIGFYSRQLRGAEKGYSVTELETLVIVAGINFYDRFLYGQHFVVVTDHKPSTTLLGNSHLNKRLRHFAMSLQKRDMNIVYRAGGQHLNADAMSRRTWELTDSPFPQVVEAVSEEPALGVMWGKGRQESRKEYSQEEKKEERSERGKER